MSVVGAEGVVQATAPVPVALIGFGTQLIEVLAKLIVVLSAPVIVGLNLIYIGVEESVVLLLTLKLLTHEIESEET